MTQAPFPGKAFRLPIALVLLCTALGAGAIEQKQQPQKNADAAEASAGEASAEGKGEDRADKGRLRQLPMDNRQMQVFLDDRKIGQHNFRFDNANGVLNVHSEADFEVRVVFVTLFTYEHEARENWENGCLANVESRTNENGDTFELTSRRVDAGLEFETNRSQHRLETPCPWSFAYWSPQLRERELLVNPQNGAVVAVDFEQLGQREVTVNGRKRALDAWQLRGRDVTEGNGHADADADVEITIYYDDQDRWVGLDSAVGNGRTLRYRVAPGDIAYPGS